MRSTLAAGSTMPVVLHVIRIILCAFLETNCAVAGAGDKIVGRWDLVSYTVTGQNVVQHKMDKSEEGRHYVRFSKDGTYTSTIGIPHDAYPLNKSGGTYKMLSKKFVEIDAPGMVFGRRQVECEYKLEGNTLTLKWQVPVADTKAEYVFNRVD